MYRCEVLSFHAIHLDVCNMLLNLIIFLIRCLCIFNSIFVVFLSTIQMQLIPMLQTKCNALLSKKWIALQYRTFLKNWYFQSKSRQTVIVHKFIGSASMRLALWWYLPVISQLPLNFPVCTLDSRAESISKLYPL